MFPPCPNMSFAYFLLNIHILIVTKYFSWASGGGEGTHRYRTFPVLYIFDSKNEKLETKFRSNLILIEKLKQMTRNLINIFMATDIAENL